MNINQLKTSNSKYLKQSDVLKPLLVTIDAVTQELIEFDEESSLKAVVTFKEDVKPMVANNTNLEIMAGFLGDESDDWAGQQVVIYVDTTVMFGPKRVGGLRVRPPKGAAFKSDEAPF